MKPLQIIAISIVLIFFSCKNGTQEKLSESEPKKPLAETYKNDTWHFQIDFQAPFIPLESKLAGDVPVVNIFNKSTEENPPFAFHEAPTTHYISFMPDGFGTEAPSGKKLSFSNWDGNMPLQFEFDEEKSTVFLLENETPWAFLIQFKNPPPSWTEYGTIFIHLPIQDFEATCIDRISGEMKPMNECDPLGNDTVEYSGNVTDSDIEITKRMLQTLQFYKGEKEETPISDLLKIEKPLPNMDVSSPLKIEGNARGYWFFEASAPVTIVDKDYNVLAESYIEATGDWMTENFVPFEGTIQFNAPDDERGYLVFQRANPSGKEENDREFRLPVIFPPK